MSIHRRDSPPRCTPRLVGEGVSLSSAEETRKSVETSEGKELQCTVEDSAAATEKEKLRKDFEAGFEETPQEQRVRLEAELDFVQSLLNPQYLYFLLSEGYFSKKAFRAYLRYLSYWRKEPYIHLVRFPAALELLSVLQSPQLEHVADAEAAVRLIEQTLKNHWLTLAQDIHRE